MNISKIQIQLMLTISLLTACAAPAATAVPPTVVPTSTPVPAPTTVPTSIPTIAPTLAPTIVPTATPAPKPTATDIPLPTKVPQPTGEPTAVAALTGVYTTVITLAQLKTIRGLEDSDCAYSGTYTLTLGVDSWDLTQAPNKDCFTSGFFSGGGAVLFQPQRLVFTQKFETVSSVPHPFTWSVAGSKLTLHKVIDQCPPFETVFSISQWTKLKS